MIKNAIRPLRANSLARSGCPQCGALPGTGAGLCGHKTQQTYNRLIFNVLQNMVF